jgi:hypothetical protein
MKVIASVSGFWHLIDEGTTLILTVSCEHSFVGYDFTMKLDSEEVGHYRSEGSAYLSRLAEAINYSCPIARGSASPYKDRNIYSQYWEAINSAVEAWEGMSLNAQDRVRGGA